jgi:hypothetical protein
MHLDSTWPWLIPLRQRNGQIRAFALVDEEDLTWAKEFRWHGHPSPSKKLYVARWIGYDEAGKRHRELIHRRILGLEEGNPLFGDHINQDPLDNRRANLRILTRSQNMLNTPGRGVAWIKWRKRWSAQITVGGITHHGGFFKDEQEALAKARSLYATHNPLHYLPEV